MYALGGELAETELTKLLFPTPIGDLAIALDDEMVVSTVLDPSDEQRQGFLPIDQLEPTEFLENVLGQLSEYFAGARRDLGLRFDLSRTEMPGFDSRVFREVARIPYGKTRTYQRIASAAGHPDGYRQVLAVLVNNPLPILVPCHRVVTNKSGIGSYIAGKERKKWLLAMEKETYKERLRTEQEEE